MNVDNTLISKCPHKLDIISTIDNHTAYILISRYLMTFNDL